MYDHIELRFGLVVIGNHTCDLRLPDCGRMTGKLDSGSRVEQQRQDKTVSAIRSRFSLTPTSQLIDCVLEHGQSQGVMSKFVRVDQTANHFVVRVGRQVVIDIEAAARDDGLGTTLHQAGDFWRVAESPVADVEARQSRHILSKTVAWNESVKAAVLGLKSGELSYQPPMSGPEQGDQRLTERLEQPVLFQVAKQAMVVFELVLQGRAQALPESRQIARAENYCGAIRVGKAKKTLRRSRPRLPPIPTKLRRGRDFECMPKNRLWIFVPTYACKRLRIRRVCETCQNTDVVCFFSDPSSCSDQRYARRDVSDRRNSEARRWISEIS